VVALFDASDGRGLFELFGSGMKRAVPMNAVETTLPDLLAKKGHITGSTRIAGDAHHASYALTAERGEWELDLDIDAAGEIIGLHFREPEKAPPVAQSDIPLGLPFRGKWVVGWGGEHADVNHHVGAPSQRRAADLLMRGEDGKTHRTDGKKNEDYLAYGQEILAVADGVVVSVVDGVTENVPGEMNTYFVPGNSVIVRHTPSLYSAYAHLQPGIRNVKPGAKVKRGDVIGRCGNSGNSSEPHLHFQLQDGPLFEKSWGVEARFPSVRVTRAGKTEDVANYTFLKDDVIEAPKK